MGSIIKFWLGCLITGASFGHGAFDCAEMVLALVALFATRIGPKDYVLWEVKLKKCAQVMFFGLFVAVMFVWAPYARWNDADEARKRDEETLAAKPTPVKTKYLILANQLLDEADKGDKLVADGKWSQFGFWDDFLAEFESRIERGRIELAEHGQRSDKFNEFSMRLEVNFLAQHQPSYLRVGANEMKRLAEQLNE